MFNKNWWFLNFQKEFLNFSFCIRKLAVAFYMINEIQRKIKFQNIVQCPFKSVPLISMYQYIMLFYPAIWKCFVIIFWVKAIFYLQTQSKSLNEIDMYPSGSFSYHTTFILGPLTHPQSKYVLESWSYSTHTIWSQDICIYINWLELCVQYHVLLWSCSTQKRDKFWFSCRRPINLNFEAKWQQRKHYMML